MTECDHGYPELRYCPWCKHTAPAATIVLEHADWHTNATHALTELAGSGRPFTSEDVTDIAGFPAAHAANRNNRVGLLIQRNARLLGLRRIGLQAARNPQSNGRSVTVWVGRAAR